MGLIVVGIVLIAAVAGVAWQVDDWRRDLSTNFAGTSDDGADELLRPVRTSHRRERVIELVKESAAALSQWALVDVQSSSDRTTLHFVRTTPLLRFKDDIQVTVADTASGATIHAESKSRVGRGDLGQNPRNLKELLGRLRTLLDAEPATERTPTPAPK